LARIRSNRILDQHSVAVSVSRIKISKAAACLAINRNLPRAVGFLEAAQRQEPLVDSLAAIRNNNKTRAAGFLVPPTLHQQEEAYSVGISQPRAVAFSEGPRLPRQRQAAPRFSGVAINNSRLVAASSEPLATSRSREAYLAARLRQEEVCLVVRATNRKAAHSLAAALISNYLRVL
jgi:hypothetical protein